MVAGALLYLYILTELVACMTVLEGSLLPSQGALGMEETEKDC